MTREATRLLAHLNNGDERVLGELMRLVYAERARARVSRLPGTYSS
jgi:hypothetical protein